MNVSTFTAVRYAAQPPTEQDRRFLIFPMIGWSNPCVSTTSAFCTVTSPSDGKEGSRQVLSCLQSWHVKDVKRFDRHPRVVRQGGPFQGEEGTG